MKIIPVTWDPISKEIDDPTSNLGSYWLEDLLLVTWDSIGREIEDLTSNLGFYCQRD